MSVPNPTVDKGFWSVLRVLIRLTPLFRICIIIIPNFPPSPIWAIPKPELQSNRALSSDPLYKRSPQRMSRGPWFYISILQVSRSKIWAAIILKRKLDSEAPWDFLRRTVRYGTVPYRYLDLDAKLIGRIRMDSKNSAHAAGRDVPYMGIPPARLGLPMEYLGIPNT